MIIGGGFVGVTTATVFAEWGNEVVLLEANDQKRQCLESGQVPFYEPGLAEAWAASGVKVQSNHDEIEAPDLVFICVGTPQAADGSANLDAIDNVVSWLAYRKWDAPTIVKSTVPPGTTKHLVTPRVQQAGMNPEFLREGSALADAREPDRVVLGIADDRTATILRSIYAHLPCPKIEVDPTTAEMIKYATNSMLATRIAFSNEVGNICARVGVNVDDVMAGVGLDHRIGPHFLRAGIGFGGSCFPKDLSALAHLGKCHKLATPVLDAVLQQNAAQPGVVLRLLEEALGDLTDRQIALLGLAFKPGTSDTRDAPARRVAQLLLAAGAKVNGYDPEAGPEFSQDYPGVNVCGTPQAALRGADAAVVATEWPEFAQIPNWPPVVIDGRRCLDPGEVTSAGAALFRVGDGRSYA